MNEAKIEELSRTIDASVKELCDLTGHHIELVLGFPWAAYYKQFHPPTCPEREKPKKLPAHDDVPDVFKGLFNNDDSGLPYEPKPDEPKSEGG